MRKFLCTLLIIAFAFTLAGCAGGAGGGGTTPGGEDYTEVTFWHAMGADNQKVIDAIILAFNKTNPDIVVTHTTMGDYVALRDGILKAASAGTNPVMAQTYPDHVASYLTSKGLVAELSEYIDDPELGLKDYEIDNVVDSYWEEGHKYDSEGSIYSMPFNKSTEVMFVNTTWFRTHGVMPENPKLLTLSFKNDKWYYKQGNNDVEFTGQSLYNKYGLGAVEPKLTWEDIEEVSKLYITTDEYAALEDKSIYCAFGADSEANLFITLAQQWGGEYTSMDESNHFPFTSDDNAKAAIAWYEQGYDAGYFGTVQKFSASYTSDAFKAKQIVMALGSSAGAGYNDPKGDFEYAVLPYPQKANAAEADKYVIQQGTNVTLFNTSDPELTEAGWKFIRFLVQPEAAYLWASRTAYFPILESFNLSDAEIDTRFASAPVAYRDELKHFALQYRDDLQGIVRNEQNEVVEENGPDIKDLAKIVAWQQQKYFYTSEAFNGSSKCRDLLATLINEVLYGDSSYNMDNLDGSKAFAEIAESLKIYNK